MYRKSYTVNCTGQVPDHFYITYRKIRKISPGRGAYIFQRPFLRGLFLEGLIFGGAYKRREVCVSKSARLILGGKFASQNRLGQLIVERKFMSVICRKFLMKLALRTYIFLKRGHTSTLSICTKEIKAKSEEEPCKQQFNHANGNLSNMVMFYHFQMFILDFYFSYWILL